MKRLALALIFALGLSACATIQNPVNRTELATVEASYGIALSVAVAYRSLPLCKTGTVATYSNVCAQRSVILKLQAADRKAQGALAAARNFIRNNPTLSAAAILGAAELAIGDFRAVQEKYGVK